MDLSTLDTATLSDQGAKMEVQHPVNGSIITDATGGPVTITLAGKDSKRYRDADRRISNKRLATQQAGRRVALTSESLENDALERLVAVTLEWNSVGLSAGPLECTPANVREVYKTLVWLREQVEAFVDDRANFLKTPSSS